MTMYSEYWVICPSLILSLLEYNLLQDFHGCMRQELRAGALGRPRGMGWGGRREGGSGWGTHVNPWLIHVNVWLKPLQYCKVISLQLTKINEKKKNRFSNSLTYHCTSSHKHINIHKIYSMLVILFFTFHLFLYISKTISSF